MQNFSVTIWRNYRACIIIMYRLWCYSNNVYCFNKCTNVLLIVSNLLPSIKNNNTYYRSKGFKRIIPTTSQCLKWRWWKLATCFLVLTTLFSISQVDTPPCQYPCWTLWGFKRDSSKSYAQRNLQSWVTTFIFYKGYCQRLSNSNNLGSFPGTV